MWIMTPLDSPTRLRKSFYNRVWVRNGAVIKRELNLVMLETQASSSSKASQWISKIPVTKIFLGLHEALATAGSGFVPVFDFTSKVLPAIKGSANYRGVGSIWVGVAFEVVSGIALHLLLGSFFCCCYGLVMMPPRWM
ncbi:hypothetical protein Acr_00g0051190 [Actinidia rufa]|uniref:Uncharacterized protein n=1 Tax=Actinidia rufa TaxID=165716 RepID=A0A7J0DKQ9_9ERIC|nr:hypothetical protein Acr_00g0051190 [Actinidia rufa]